MKQRLILMMAMIVWTLSIAAQGVSRSELDEYEKSGHNTNENVSLTHDRDQSGSNAYAAGSILQGSSDNSVAYYQHVAKQHGWYVGIGPELSHEEARHLNVVYKLSIRNSAGHWMKMEAIDGYGKLTTEHNIKTYINLLPTNMINQKWREKITNACQWELMADARGEGMLMERAYDENMNLIYNYQPVVISEHEVVGSYTDSWGMPIKLSGSTCFWVNHILDKWGNDSIVKIFDDKGDLIQLFSGAWIIQNICDKQGNVIENFSLNKLGGKINDDWGNCSWKSTRDSYGNELTCKYFDAGGHTARLSQDKTFDNSKEERNTYDRWHRLKTIEFYDGDIPDTTFQGVHRKEYSYNDHGQVIEEKITGPDNKPRAYEDDGHAYDYKTYDERGRLLSRSLLGVDSTLLDNDDFYCLWRYYYSGDIVSRTEVYSRNGSDTALWFLETHSPLEHIYFYKNKTAFIDTLDTRGNLLSRTYISYTQDPLTLPERMPSGLYYPCSRIVKSYLYGPNTCQITTTFYDKDGNWARSDRDNSNSPARTVITTDSIRHFITHIEYDSDSIIRANYKEKYDDTFQKIIFKQSLTTLGEVGRSGLNDALYYKTKIEYTPSGKVASTMFLNEFDEPAYAYADNKTYCYKLIDESGNALYYDENQNSIEGNKVSETRAAYLEVVNSNGICNGFKDGDILIRYGDWYYNHHASPSSDNIEDLYVQMVFSASQDSIDIWVLRHFPTEGKSIIQKLRVKGATSSNLGIAVHEIYYTNREIQRYLRTYMAFRHDEEQKGTPITPIKRQTDYTGIILVPSYKPSGNSAYLHGWHNPVLLIAKKSIGKEGWPSSEPRQIWYYSGKNRIPWSSKAIYHVTEDGICLHRDSVSHYLTHYEWNYVDLTKEEHDKLTTLICQVQNKYAKDLIPNKSDYISTTLGSQPSSGLIHAKEMIQVMQDEDAARPAQGVNPQILAHIEGIDTMVVLRAYSSIALDATRYRDLTYHLDKMYYNQRVEPVDTALIAQQGIVFLHEIEKGIDEVLYLSPDTVVWAQGLMTHGTKNIIKSNFLGEEYNPSDKYNREDLNLKNHVAAHGIATYWQAYEAYEKSMPVLQYLCKRKYSPAYKDLAQAYLKGSGVPVDSLYALVLYHKALRLGESVQDSLGELYYQMNLYKKAMPYLKSGKDTESKYLIGRIFEKGGDGVIASPDSAQYYYKLCVESASNENIREQYAAAIERVSREREYTLNDFRDLPQSIVQSTSVDTLLRKGLQYASNGDYINSFSYLKAAADANDPRAESLITFFYNSKLFPIYNKQISIDYCQRAISHYLERAEKGDGTAYRRIGELYETKDVDGNGPNILKAKEYYQKGLDHNDFYAAPALGQIYKDELNYSAALDVFLLGAKAGDADCMFQTAFLYDQGLGGVERNVAEAIHWYRECYETDGSENAKKALLRLGVPLVRKLKEADLVGVWSNKTSGIKVFLPKGGFFAFYTQKFNDISRALKEFSFSPWMLGRYFVSGNSQYVEDIELRNTHNYLGEQHMTCKIDNNVMRASWEDVSNEIWERLPDSDKLIKYVMENWTLFEKYLREKLQ